VDHEVGVIMFLAIMTPVIAALDWLGVTFLRNIIKGNRR